MCLTQISRTRIVCHLLKSSSQETQLALTRSRHMQHMICGSSCIELTNEDQTTINRAIEQQGCLFNLGRGRMRVTNSQSPSATSWCNVSSTSGTICMALRNLLNTHQNGKKASAHSCFLQSDKSPSFIHDNDQTNVQMQARAISHRPQRSVHHQRYNLSRDKPSAA